MVRLETAADLSRMSSTRFRGKQSEPWVSVREVQAVSPGHTSRKQESAHELPWISPFLPAAIANYLVGFAGWHMHLDEPFPLDAVPSRVRHALLGEFKGRWPSVREVDQIPDKHWLTAPGMGPASLQIIRSITNAARQQDVSHATSHHLSDAELLRRLEGLQEDLRWLEAQLEARIAKGPRRRPQRQEHNRATRNEADLQDRETREAETSEHRSDQGHIA
jgi:hypothetical protein